MAIPLVASAAPIVDLTKALANMVTPPSDMTGSVAVGAWTNSGGTMTADSSASYWVQDTGQTHSIKSVTTADSQSVTLPLTGTFKAGVEYIVTFAICYEEALLNLTVTTQFGSAGASDFVVQSPTVSATMLGNYRLHTLRWVPTADRTSGVALIITRVNPSTAGTITIHVGYVYVRRTSYVGEYPIIKVAGYNSDNLEMQMGIRPSLDWIYLGPEPVGGPSRRDTGLGFGYDSSIVLATGLQHTYLSLYDKDTTGAGAGSVYAFAESSVPIANSQTLPNGAIPGWDFETGDDYVGHLFFEKDSTTLGWIPDQAGQDIHLWSRRNFNSSSGDWRALSRNSSHSMVLWQSVANPMTAQDDLILGGTESYTSTCPWTFIPDGSGNAQTGFFGGTIEGVMGFAQAFVSVEGTPSGTQAVTWNIWISLNNFSSPGSSKTLTMHLRRTNAAGAILATDSFTTSTDSRAGHQHQWTGTFNDASPTDGIYVISAVGGNSNTDAYADTFAMGVSGTRLGNPTRLAKGSDYQVLAVDVSDHHAKWLNLPLKKLAGQTIGNTSTTIAHGLGLTPTIVIITPRSNATFWEASVADGTNVYIQSSATSQTADIYVAP